MGVWSRSARSCPPDVHLALSPSRQLFSAGQTSMDDLKDQTEALKLDAPSPGQLNLAAIFIRTLEGTESDAQTAGSLESLWEVLTEGCTDEERETRMVSLTNHTCALLSTELTLSFVVPGRNRPLRTAHSSCFLRSLRFSTDPPRLPTLLQSCFWKAWASTAVHERSLRRWESSWRTFLRLNGR